MRPVRDDLRARSPGGRRAAHRRPGDLRRRGGQARAGRARVRPLQRGRRERRDGPHLHPVRQAVPAHLRRVPPLRRDVPHPLQVVTQQRPLHPRYVARSRSCSTSDGDQARGDDAHLLRGHPPGLHERRGPPREPRAPREHDERRVVRRHDRAVGAPRARAAPRHRAPQVPRPRDQQRRERRRRPGGSRRRPLGDVPGGDALGAHSLDAVAHGIRAHRRLAVAARIDCGTVVGCVPQATDEAPETFPANRASGIWHGEGAVDYRRSGERRSARARALVARARRGVRAVSLGNLAGVGGRRAGRGAGLYADARRRGCCGASTPFPPKRRARCPTRRRRRPEARTPSTRAAMPPPPSRRATPQQLHGRSSRSPGVQRSAPCSASSCCDDAAGVNGCGALRRPGLVPGRLPGPADAGSPTACSQTHLRARAVRRRSSSRRATSLPRAASSGSCSTASQCPGEPRDHASFIAFFRRLASANMSTFVKT